LSRLYRIVTLEASDQLPVLSCHSALSSRAALYAVRGHGRDL